MARFTTRVELHNAKEPDDYETLHKEMAKENFTRAITSDDGKNIIYRQQNITKMEIIPETKY